MDKEMMPSMDYLKKILEKLKGMKGQQITDAMIENVIKSSAGHAGAMRKAQMAQKASEITEYRPFIPIEASEAPAKFTVLPKPGTYKHPSYGNIKITKERNEKFVSNFNSKVYQDKVPIDAEHQTKLSGAYGWINQLEMNEDGSVDASVEWTDRGTSAIADDSFKYFSPEWYDEWQDPATKKKYTDVLIGGALTTRPFFKESSLKPLVASEMALEDGWVDDTLEFKELPDNVSLDQIRDQLYSQLRTKFPRGANELDYCYVSDIFPGYFIYSDSKGKYFKADYEVTDTGTATANFDEVESVARMTTWRSIAASEENNLPPQNLTNNDTKTPKRASEERPMTMQFTDSPEYKSMSEEIATLKSQVEEANKAKTASEEAQSAAEKKFSDAMARIDSLETAGRRQRFAELIKTPSKWYGEPEKLVARLEKLATAFGEDSDDFKEFVAEQQAQAEQMNKSEIFAEKGHAQRTEEVAGFAGALKAYKEEHSDATDSEAMEAVVSANPKFYSEYRDAMNKAASNGAKDSVKI